MAEALERPLCTNSYGKVKSGLETVQSSGGVQSTEKSELAQGLQVWALEKWLCH